GQRLVDALAVHFAVGGGHLGFEPARARLLRRIRAGRVGPRRRERKEGRPRDRRRGQERGKSIASGHQVHRTRPCTWLGFGPKNSTSAGGAQWRISLGRNYFRDGGGRGPRFAGAIRA